jgi:hypothetical protein
MAGPIAWGCQRKPKTSRSSYEAKIYCMDEGCKTRSKTLYHLMTDLSLLDIAQPIPLFNDNLPLTGPWAAPSRRTPPSQHPRRGGAVHDTQKAGIVNIHHVPGHSNVANIFTKEHKSDAIFYELAFQLIRPRDLFMKWMDSGITKDSGGAGRNPESLSSISQRLLLSK